MGGNLTLEQIKAALAASQASPKPWDVPQNAPAAPMAPPAAPPMAPPANPAMMNPNQDALAQAQRMMQQRGQLAPLGTEKGMVGLQGQGISAQDATLLQKLMKLFGM